ncbi:phospholipase D-like domain-containing protein [Paracoccus aerodenitrificans]|uniref:phospholipase D-like domain-containing protein n=1 Tax=Paracoccus aerodenitrificans TaxID=3017781 RepID=UPI0022F03ACF|nr:phospholipase D-like domain-containing protein [Paracoccus aerodenitrificans]WBU63452.1 phospholipase D-like domain-containing protein [Paracoccus aerodenitrificans]
MNQLSFQPGENCWRVEKAEQFGIIIDAEKYFRALREALEKAEDLIILVGWDFDFEIEMLPGESDESGNAPDGLPNRIGPFLEALAERRPNLEIYLLKWSGGALIAPGRMLPTAKIKLLSPDQVHLGFDGRHPIGASHHQKIVTIDDSLAFCGGIDVTDGRWDTREHAPGDKRRTLKNGDIAQPWHDVTSVMSGPAAEALSELCRARWKRAQDTELEEPIKPGRDRWPQSLRAEFRDIDVAIVRTEPPETDRPVIVEIEQLYLDSIASAKETIYLESQYFASDVITDAVRKKLQEPDGPEIVVINPKAAQGVIEDQAMHVTRSRMIRDLRASDPHDRFRVFYPVNSDQDPVYVHAKVSIIDDRFMRVGSANIDRRSMAFDTECDVALIAEREEDRQQVLDLRNDLLAEHLGCSKEDLARAIEHNGSIISAIDSLNRRDHRGLRDLPLRKENMFGSLLADTRFFDPRYRRSAMARFGVTSRHVMIGGVAIAAGLYLWSRKRRR